MKKIKKRIKKKKDVIFNTSPKIKISEFIKEYASDYINMGNTMEERQSYLNGACCAWNIAVLPENLREKALKNNLEEYKKVNPGIDDSEDFLHDMRLLVNKKNQMFPEVKKAIVDAFIEPINETQFRINVISTNNLQQLKQMLTKKFS